MVAKAASPSFSSRPPPLRYGVCGLVLLALLLVWQFRHGPPLSTDLLELTPTLAQDALLSHAQARVDAPLAQQLVVLVGHAEAAQALQLAQRTAAHLGTTPELAKVQLTHHPDVEGLRGALLAGRLALLPAAVRQQLVDAPNTFAADRARALLDPFSAATLVPLHEDLLGFSQRIETHLRPATTLQFDLASHTLSTTQDGVTWVLIHVHMHDSAFQQHASTRLAAAVNEARQIVAADAGQLLAAGGALYAAAGAEQARSESSGMGSVSVVGMLCVLLFSLRHPRALLAFVPVAVSLAAGFAACVWVFGHIHILTLVIGVSLLGIALDYPLHWFGKVYAPQPWQAWPSLLSVRQGLTISLLTTLIGYLALIFTPFPALTQTAVFSVAGLSAAYACTLYLLPAWVQHWQPRPSPHVSRVAQALLNQRAAIQSLPRVLRWGALGGAVVLVVLGLQRLDLHDDMRQWLSVPPALLEEAQRIGALTGLQPTSQFYVVSGATDTELLQRTQALAQALDAHIAAGQLQRYDALSQIATTVEQQAALRNQLRRLAEQTDPLPALSAIGLPPAELQHSLRAVAALPTLSLSEILASPLAERWRGLALGAFDGKQIGLVTLHGLPAGSASHAALQHLAALADTLPGVRWVDRNGALNALFSATRLQAAELKLASYAVAAVLLCWAFGAAASARILCVPLFASACTLAALGALGQPVTLFALFGLLLVTALGVDYAIFMHEGIGGARTCLIGVSLGALTTLLSFGLLAASATPAIAGFGLTVAIGVLFSVLFAAWLPAAPSANTFSPTDRIYSGGMS